MMMTRVFFLWLLSAVLTTEAIIVDRLSVTSEDLEQMENYTTPEDLEQMENYTTSEDLEQMENYTTSEYLAHTENYTTSDDLEQTETSADLKQTENYTTFEDLEQTETSGDLEQTENYTTSDDLAHTENYTTSDDLAHTENYTTSEELEQTETSDDLEQTENYTTPDDLEQTDNYTTPDDLTIDLKGIWYKQRLDHFTTDHRTWDQRYWVRSDFYVKGGPVFLKLGAEWTMDGISLEINEPWKVYAETHHAMMFQLEHRFYGESHPTGDMSDDNLIYLTTHQALADIALFITSMNREHNLTKDTRWVVFGCSWAGTLAAWARYKFPHHIYGAVASSAPLWNKPNFPEYFDVVRESIRTYGDNCVYAIQEAFQEIDDLMDDNGSEIITQTLSLCDSLDEDDDDVINLFDTLATELQTVVQFNKYNHSISGWTLDKVCDVMTSNTTSPLARFVQAMRSYGTYPRDCLNHTYNDRTEKLQRFNWITGNAERQFIYQMCTEYGNFQTSESTNSFLGTRLPMDFYIQLCDDVYGDRFKKEFIDKTINNTNTVYGGVDLQATRVIYVHGSLDPWKAVGITKTKTVESPAILIDGVSHCADSYACSDHDPPSLISARQNISDIIGQWLQATN